MPSRRGYELESGLGHDGNDAAMSGQWGGWLAGGATPKNSDIALCLSMDSPVKSVGEGPDGWTLHVLLN